MLPSFHLLSEEELAQLNRDDLEEYSQILTKEAYRLRYSLTSSNTKLQRRLKAIREGKDPDTEILRSKKTIKVHCDVPKTIKSKKTILREKGIEASQDSVSSFLVKGNVILSSDAMIGAKDLFTRYTKYSKSKHKDALNIQQFREELIKKGFEQVKKGKMFWLEIGPVEEEE